jgi:thiaminase/transcriptional activator TenA
MTPGMRLYAFLGQSLAEGEGLRPGNAYEAWIRTYADPGFEALAARLERLLDQHGRDARQEALRAAYRRAMQLELAFFSAHARAQEV